SSRRRHTSFSRDWSSDVCSSDLEAVINPAVASMYPKEKTKWLNILHAGWPTGLVFGGILALVMGSETEWRLKIILILLPAIAYGIMMFPLKFPVNERVKAGVSYLEMLKEVGAGGALIVVALIVFQLGVVFEWSVMLSTIITLGVVRSEERRVGKECSSRGSR